MTNVIQFLVSNRLFALLLTMTLAGAAWVNLPNLRVSQYPDVHIPMLTINVVLPAASAFAIERQVINPIEDKLEGLRDLKTIETRINNSFAQIAIEFDRGTDVSDKYTEAYAMLNNLKPDLPGDTEIVVLKQDPTDRLVSFVLSISSPLATGSELVRATEDLKEVLRRVGGVENLTVIKPVEEIAVQLDLPRMARLGIDVSDVSAAIYQSNQFMPTGEIEVGEKSISLLADNGGLANAEDVAAVRVVSTTGTSVALKDFASVEQSVKRNSIRTTTSGRPSIWLTMKLNEDANVFDTRALLETEVQQFSSDLPDHYSVDWLFDVEGGVDAKLSELIGNIVAGVLILAVVLFFAIGYRSSFIVTTMLPVALLLSLIGLSFTGYGIQEISLAGFVISLGLIVDAGIVVTENAFKLRTYSGYDQQTAAVEGTAVVMGPLVSSTLTTALAFAPIFLLDSVTGLFLHSFVVTIWLCLAASLLAAVIYAALLLARIGTDNRLLNLPAVPSFMNRLKPFRDQRYTAFLRAQMQRPMRLYGIVVVLLIGALGLGTTLDVIVFPDSEEPYFTVTIAADKDRSTAFMERVSAEIHEQVSGNADVLDCATIIGATFPAVHTGIRWYPDARFVGTVFCHVDFRDSEKLNRLVRDLSQALEPYRSSANIEVAPFINGEGVDNYDVEIELVGRDIRALRADARRIEDRLREASLPALSYINNPARSDWFAYKIEVLDRSAAALGVERAAIDQAIMLLTRGIEVDEIEVLSGARLPVMLKVAFVDEAPLDEMLVPSNRGTYIPLSQLTRMTAVDDEFDIYHEAFRPILKIGLRANEDASLAEFVDSLSSAMAGFETSAGVDFRYGGQLAVASDAFGGAGRYVGIILLLILAIFVLQFKSLIQPLVVLAAIPLSFIGAFFLLFITNQPLSFLSFVGLTSLMGIVINNSILLVDEGNRLQAEQPQTSRAEIAIAAGVNRFMPILLTSITSMVGLLPLALGDSMFKALAIAVIGGLFTATALTLVVVPMLYAITPRSTLR